MGCVGVKGCGGGGCRWGGGGFGVGCGEDGGDGGKGCGEGFGVGGDAESASSAPDHDVRGGTMRADGRDEWATPPEVYQQICEHWQLQPQIDVFASADNAKCKHFFTTEEDAFSCLWVEEAKLLGVPPVFWMNPPYSQPTLTEAIKKAIRETLQGGTTIFLLPAFVDQSWYHEYIYNKFRHEIWKGRIKFLPPDGIKPSSPRYGNIHGVIRDE